MLRGCKQILFLENNFKCYIRLKFVNTLVLMRNFIISFLENVIKRISYDIENAENDEGFDKELMDAFYKLSKDRSESSLAGGFAMKSSG